MSALARVQVWVSRDTVYGSLGLGCLELCRFTMVCPRVCMYS